MKLLESSAEIKISPETCFFMRLDGCSFGTFTREMDRPFDMRFAEAMIQTTEDILLKFNCLTGFTQSDEITLYFPPCFIDKGQTHLYSGRTQKLCSIIAAYTSVRFNTHMKCHQWSDAVKNKLDKGVYFDARIIIPENDTDVLNCFLWRQQYECRRNAVMAIAQSNFSSKELHGVSCRKAEELLLEKGCPVESFPDSCLYGTYVKKTLEEKLAKNPKTSAEETCFRTGTSRLSTKDAITSEYIVAKYAERENKVD